MIEDNKCEVVDGSPSNPSNPPEMGAGHPVPTSDAENIVPCKPRNTGATSGKRNINRPLTGKNVSESGENTAYLSPRVDPIGDASRLLTKGEKSSKAELLYSIAELHDLCKELEEELLRRGNQYDELYRKLNGLHAISEIVENQLDNIKYTLRVFKNK